MTIFFSFRGYIISMVEKIIKISKKQEYILNRNCTCQIYKYVRS
jgi:hypothetical protein